MKSIALLIVALLLFQHMNITNASRTREHFYTAWNKYRRHIYGCRCTSIFCVVLFTVIAVEGTTGVEVGVTAAVVGLLTTREYTTLIVLTFLISLLKVLLEDHMEKSLLRRSPTIKSVWLKDIWLLWILGSALFSVFLGGLDILDRQFIEDHQYILATAMVFIVFLTYDFWIYNVLHRQLVVGDGFMSSAVSQIYQAAPGNPGRGFLGFLLFTIQRQPPAQVMIIGPKGTGKTRWTMSHDAAYAARVQSRIVGEGEGIFSTQVVELATKIESVPVRSANDTVIAGFSLQLLDFPGENIGDHCTLPFDLRCDVLVLMLPEEAFNPALDERSETFDVTTSDDLGEYFSPDDAAARARDYFYALFFGLNVDEGSKNVAGRQRFGIGSFVLIVNSRKGSLRYRNHFEQHIESLAVQMANKFGLEETRRCFHYYCNITTTQDLILPNAIASLHNTAQFPDVQTGPTFK